MKQKRTLSLLLCLALLVSVLLNGCGSNGPEESKIEADLNACLAEQFGNEFSFVSKETIGQFFSGDSYYNDSYYVTGTAVARGKYAQIEVLITADYTKYDSGWKNDDMTMGLIGFIIHTFPDEAELVNARNSASALEVTYTDFAQENTTLVGQGYVDAPYSDLFNIRGNTTTYWSYSLDENEWVIEREYQDYYGALSRNIEGSFKIHNGTVSRIYVRNQTETSLEILDTREGEEWVKVDLIPGGNNVTEYSLNNGLFSTYVGFFADGEEVTVTLSDFNDLQISIDYQYSMVDVWGYWDTFIPA